MSGYSIKEKLVGNNGCHQLRQQSEKLLQRMTYLKLPERRFLELAYHHGMNIRHISQVTRLTPRTVIRRLAHIRKLLAADRYVKSVLADQGLTPQQQAIAYDSIVKGIGYRRISVNYKITKYRARKTISQLRKQLNM